MNFKKLIALFLAVLLAIMHLSVSIASAEGVVDCPYVEVHGFMASSIHKVKNDPTSEVLWPPSTEKILAVVEECVPALLEFLITKDYDALGGKIIGPLKEIFSGVNLDENGLPSDGTGIVFNYPNKSSITKSSRLKFAYDWRCDPMDIAVDLNDFIDYILEASGCEQVVVESHSFGGIVVETYTELYGSEKLKSVCYNTPAIFGETYTGELLNTEIELTADSVTAFLKEMLGHGEYKKLLLGVFDILKASGITEDICELGTGIVDNLGKEMLVDILLPMFGSWPSIWSMVPASYVDRCMTNVFDNLYKGNGIDYSGLINKIENYDTIVRANSRQTLLEQNESTNVYVFSRYGFSSIPVTPSWDYMSDSVIDTKYSSMGACCAPYNGKLSDKFLAEHINDPYLNPDKTIYAKTCLFPDQTWFFRELHHSKNTAQLNEFISKLLYYDGQATTNTFEEYPQFLLFDVDTEIFAPDKGTVYEKKTFFDKIFEFNLKVITFFKNLFKLFFG